jgi:polar amino acid transport system substrate-binding protein
MAGLCRKATLPLALVVALLTELPSFAQSGTLRVGIAGSPPFVVQNGDRLEGISLEVWEEVAQTTNLDYTLIPHKNVEASLDALARGELDVAIGPIGITPKRLEKVTFTQPFFLAQIGVLLPRQAPTVWSRVRPFFTIAAISSVGFLCISLFIVGNLLWLFERNQNAEQFPKAYHRGVGNGMWFALVTLTTVGYGDRAPITSAGRFIAGVWMVVTMITASSLTAGLATAFTLALSERTTEQFVRLEDLTGARMAVVSGTTSEQWADYYQVNAIARPTLSKAIELLATDRVEGVVFDRPALEYYLQQNPDLDLRLAEFVLATETYGFALPNDSSLTQTLNVSLLHLFQLHKLKEIEHKWLKPEGALARMEMPRSGNK